MPLPLLNPVHPHHFLLESTTSRLKKLCSNFVQFEMFPVPHPVCSCHVDTTNLVNYLPMEAEVPFESVIRSGQRIRLVWERVKLCGRCYLDLQVIRVLIGTTDRLLALYEAAAKVYMARSPTSSRSSTSASKISPQSSSESTIDSPSLPTCAKSQATLGEIFLEDEEAGLLASMVLANDLAKLRTLLRDLRNHLQTIYSHANNLTTQFNIRELESFVSSSMSRLHTLLGSLQT